MFDNAQQLKAELAGTEPEEFFEKYVLGGATKHFPDRKITHFCEQFSESFNMELPKESIFIVGSARIGFALHDKKKYGLQAFRPFGAESDIDITICNDELFRKIWYELSAHACIQNYSPWNSEGLSEYLIYGWLRPDKFPKGKTLRHCNTFYEAVGKIRRDRQNGHPKISVALYYSVEQLRRYQTRSIRMSKNKLEAA